MLGCSPSDGKVGTKGQASGWLDYVVKGFQRGRKRQNENLTKKSSSYIMLLKVNTSTGLISNLIINYTYSLPVYRATVFTSHFDKTSCCFSIIEYYQKTAFDRIGFIFIKFIHYRFSLSISIWLGPYTPIRDSCSHLIIATAYWA